LSLRRGKPATLALLAIGAPQAEAVRIRLLGRESRSGRGAILHRQLLEPKLIRPRTAADAVRPAAASPASKVPENGWAKGLFFITPTAFARYNSSAVVND